MTITIGNKLHEGGEGAIYEIVNDSTRVVKIYHENKRTPERFRKLEIMIENPPENPTKNHISFTWPERICLMNHELVGYIMPRISNMEPILNLMLPKNLRIFIHKHAIPTNLELILLLRAAYNICHVVKSLHDKGYVIGDLNDQNVLVNGRGLVTIVDTDSFQVKDPETEKIYPCPVGKAEYTHPQVLRELTQNKKSFSDIIQYPYHDDYGLAVIIFRLLMNGCYPYAGTPPKNQDMSIEERIVNGIFPFSGEPRGWGPPPAFEHLYMERTSEELRQLFRRAFVESAREPSACPSAAEFAKALERMEKEYENAVPQSPYSPPVPTSHRSRKQIFHSQASLINIGNKLHEGGEGAIYEIVNDSTRVIKIYHEHKRTKERFKKLEIMIENPPENPTAKYNHISFTWPEMLCLENDKPVGYIMPRISNMEPILNLMLPENLRIFIHKHAIPPNLEFIFLLRAAYNICHVVKSLHDKGYVIGDLNDQNVLVNGRGLVTIVDTDSFQVRDPETGKIYPCPVGKPEYTHPEVLRELTQNKKSFSGIIQYPYHDDYGLAVIIFRLLMNGCYPYAGTPPKNEDISIEERIMNGIFPFSGEPRGWKPPPGFERLYMERTSEELRQLFRRAFVESAREPSACPSAAEFAKALERMEKEYENAVPPSPYSPPVPTSRRSRKWMFMLLAVLLAGILYYRAQGDNSEASYKTQQEQYQEPLPEADAKASRSMKSPSPWAIYNSSNSPLPYDGLSSIVADENDQIWLGTFGGGLARLRNGKWTIYNSANSDLPHDRIYCLTKASDGTLWIGTFGGGMAQFDGEEWRVYNTSNSPLPHNKVLCLAASEDGTLWIGTAGGLARKQGEEWSVYTTENSSLPNNEVKSLLLTSDGAVWVGTAKGLACLKGGEWSLYTAETVSWPSYDVQALASNRKGEIWIGTWGGGLIRLKNENWRVYSTANSALPQNYIVALAFDSEGALWIGTREKGLACYRDGEWKVYKSFNSDLPDNHVYALAIDSRQNLWAGTWKGVACLRREAQ